MGLQQGELFYRHHIHPLRTLIFNLMRKEIALGNFRRLHCGQSTGREKDDFEEMGCYVGPSNLDAPL